MTPVSDDSLPERVGRLLSDQRLTLVTAESCTGGMIGEMITAIAGSSVYYLGGVVTYSNQLKNRLLKVPWSMIEKYGAVSKECAVAMAGGARDELGADLGLSVTGIAGPTGGSEEKPVGTVFFGLADSAGIIFRKEVFLNLSRLQVRRIAAITALEMVLEKLG